MKKEQGGRDKMPVYLYDIDGKYIRNFESISDFADLYGFDRNKISNQNFHIYNFKDGRVASTKRIGRLGVLEHKKYQKSPYVGQGKNLAKTIYKKSNKGTVDIFDLDGDKIATFKSVYQAILLTDLSKDCFRNVDTELHTRDGLKIIVNSLV